MTERLGTDGYASTTEGLARHAAGLLRGTGSVEVTGQLIAACGTNISGLVAAIKKELGEAWYISAERVSGVDAYRFSV